MSVSEHIDTLRARHQQIEGMIEAEVKRLRPDEAAISGLKKEKLRIKDELAQLAATAH